MLTVTVLACTGVIGDCSFSSRLLGTDVMIIWAQAYSFLSLQCSILRVLLRPFCLTSSRTP